MIRSHDLVLAIAAAGMDHQDLCEDCCRGGYLAGCPAGIALREAILAVGIADTWETEMMANGLIGPHAVGPVLEAVQ